MSAGTRVGALPGRRAASPRLGRWVRSIPKNPLTALGALMIALFFAAAAFPELFTRIDPLAIDPVERLRPPSAAHLFGTDDLGRDVFSRVVHGTRISLVSALVVVVGAVVVGTAAGLVAGFFGGVLDEAVMRVSDVFIAFPSLVLAMAFVAVLGPSVTNAMLAVILVWWPQYARLARGQVLVLKRLDFIEAARAIGVPSVRILARHLLPNSASVIIVKSTLDIGTAVLITASLSFLGMGVRPPTPELGSMVTDGRIQLLTAWWYATFPGLAIFTLVLSFNLVGDGLRDILDPRLRNS